MAYLRATGSLQCGRVLTSLGTQYHLRYDLILVLPDCCHLQQTRLPTPNENRKALAARGCPGRDPDPQRAAGRQKAAAARRDAALS
jgi:hypothetical protein